MYLVSWKKMLKGSDEPLPLRPFDTKKQAEAYRMGCVDVIVITSLNKLEPEEVIKDFDITFNNS